MATKHAGRHRAAHHRCYETYQAGGGRLLRSKSRSGSVDSVLLAALESEYTCVPLPGQARLRPDLNIPCTETNLAKGGSCEPCCDNNHCLVASTKVHHLMLRDRQAQGQPVQYLAEADHVKHT